MSKVDDLIEKLRDEHGDRPPGEAILELEDLTNEERAQIESAFIRQTDNGPRPDDGDQSLAVAPPPELDVAADA